MTTENKITFIKAVRENVGLWINLIGGTGSGKTYTAFRLASGIAGDKPFAVIDTENRRALHYADQFNFDHAELSAPFRPAAYADAILAADKAGYPVIVIDSGSHVWAGEGGMLDWHEELMEGKGDSYKMSAWIKPKMAHKKMVQKLLQVKAHIILCLRAEEKVEMVKVNNKTEIRAKQSLTSREGWIPICDKNLPFEATVSMLLVADKPGFPHPIKLQEQHKALFPLDKPITEESGKQLAKWAAGGTAKPKAEDLESKILGMLGYFSDLGVDSERVILSIGKTSADLLTLDDVAKLKTVARDIKSGDKSLIEAFPEIVTDRETVSSAPPDPDTADDHVDADEKVEAETTERSEESSFEDMLATVKERLNELPSRDSQAILGGRKVASMDLKALTALNVEIDKFLAK